MTKRLNTYVVYTICSNPIILNLTKNKVAKKLTAEVFEPPFHPGLVENDNNTSIIENSVRLYVDGSSRDMSGRESISVQVF